MQYIETRRLTCLWRKETSLLVLTVTSFSTDVLTVSMAISKGRNSSPTMSSGSSSQYNVANLRAFLTMLDISDAAPSSTPRVLTNIRNTLSAVPLPNHRHSIMSALLPRYPVTLLVFY
jgi:hypothetical protein